MDTSSNNPNTKNWLMLALIAILAASSIYLYVSKNKQGALASMDISNALTEKKAIQQEYDAALGRLDLMKSENLEMDSLLVEKDSELSALRTKIESIINSSEATSGELKLAQELISSLNGKLDKFKKEIDILRASNKRLAKEKEKLSIDNESLNTDKTNLTKDKEQLLSTKQALESKNMEISEERNAMIEVAKKLENKVEVAKVLHASNVRLTPLKRTFLGNNEVNTNKARRTEKMRISFNLDDNRISETGEKQIYIVVYSPDGDAYENGKFSLANGTEKAFSATKTIPYVQGQASKDINIEWTPLRNSFEKGEYSVEIYHMGYIIGNEKVSLK